MAHPTDNDARAFEAKFYTKDKVRRVEVRRRSTGDLMYQGRADDVWRVHRGEPITYAERFGDGKSKKGS